ncbi:hypothetical protein NE686_17430 [Tissierella carlieri]|uniref:Uncharacterized protein n=1 Tax=Tissierella carlieri TaxID=689904 RepID=A0ABT1SEH7_9FIRM|nr:hypothetical protein [Tissierella carlieri]MCQ4924888.1 hypothetical protein [Tissierella carlieri]
MATVIIILILGTMIMYYLHPAIGFLGTLAAFVIYFYKTVIQDEIIINDAEEDL